MTSETTLAFAHPSERAAASANGLDRISVRDHIVDVEIGAFQAERGVRQRISFNVVVEVQPLTGPIDDDVDRILSYDRVTEAITYALADERLNLLETLADKVAERILLEPQAVRVFVRIEKLDRGASALGVEIVRGRDEVVPQSGETVGLAPKFVFLNDAAIASDNLAGWLDQLAQTDHPVVLCVGAGSAELPQVSNQVAQARIDLLAIEQSAWVLAAKDQRCAVVETRTELDWSMKNGQIAVWAPSKIALDAVDAPSAPSKDAVALAAWFAEMMQAQALVVIGEDLPKKAAVPMRSVAIADTSI